MLYPADIAQSRDLVLVDVRPLAERRSEVGFLPASLSLPEGGGSSEAAQRLLAEIAALPNVRGVVLHCQSGRRSRELCDTLTSPVPLFNLEGGLLAWESESLPVCRVREESEENGKHSERPRDAIEYRRHLVACFVGANAEVALDRGTTSEPYRMLQECFRQADVSWDEPSVDGLYRVLDWAAVTTFRAGGRLEDIAENLVAMETMLQAVELALKR